jgi:hypothetical protein
MPIPWSEQMNELGRKRPWPDLRNYLSFFLEGPKKPWTDLSGCPVSGRQWVPPAKQSANRSTTTTTTGVCDVSRLPSSGVMLCSWYMSCFKCPYKLASDDGHSVPMERGIMSRAGLVLFCFMIRTSTVLLRPLCVRHVVETWGHTDRHDLPYMQVVWRNWTLHEVIMATHLSSTRCWRLLTPSAQVRPGTRLCLKDQYTGLSDDSFSDE